MVKEEIYIYGLIDPRTNCICYVGYTDDPKRRLIAHTSERNVYKSPKCLWIRELYKFGLKPEMVILQTLKNANSYEAARIERDIINEMLKQGYKVFNKHHNSKHSRGSNSCQ